METGQRIRNLRKQQKLTQKECAASIGLSPSFLCDIERGRAQPPLSRLLDIATTLDTTVAYLVGTDDNSAPIPPDCLTTLHSLLEHEDGRQILQALSCFEGWTDLDRQELLQYLRVKETVRNIGR